MGTPGRAWLRLLLYIAIAALLLSGAITRAISLTENKEFNQVNWGTLNDLLFIMATLVITLAIFGILRGIHLAYRLDTNADRTYGKISDKWVSHGADSEDYLIVYSYLTNQTVRASLKRNEYERVRVGDTVSVLYLPEASHVSRIDVKCPLLLNELRSEFESS